MSFNPVGRAVYNYEDFPMYITLMRKVMKTIQIDGFDQAVIDSIIPHPKNLVTMFLANSEGMNSESQTFVYTLYSFLGVIRYKNNSQLSQVEEFSFKYNDSVPTQALFNLLNTHSNYLRRINQEKVEKTLAVLFE